MFFSKTELTWTESSENPSKNSNEKSGGSLERNQRTRSMQVAEEMFDV